MTAMASLSATSELKVLDREKCVHGGLDGSEVVPVSSLESEGRSALDAETAGVSPVVLKYDGGMDAWFAGGWLAMFCVIGLGPASFGTMENFYVQHYLPNSTPSSINWIGSLQLGFQSLVGVLVAGVFDSGHFRWLSLPGYVLFLLSLFMLSLAKENMFYQVFLSQGVGLGLAIGIIYTPISSAVSQHFIERRGLAMGIITTGTALGGTFFSIVLEKFLNGPIGFAWGVRICGFISLACLALANMLIKTNYPPPEINSGSADTHIAQASTPPGPATTVQESGMPLLRQLVRTPSYLVFIIFGFVGSLALYNPIFSIELFALREAHVSTSLGGYLLAILNTSSIFGRLFFNQMADWYGVFEVFIPCMAATAVSLYFPAVLSLDQDVSRSGLRLGLASVPVGLASLIGTPIAAALVGRDRWWAGCVFTGVLELFGAFLLLIVFLMNSSVRRQGERQRQWRTRR
ncbi:MFS-type transporter pytF [Psilocybe cubensis]|uniref:MFS-type transporter pytF n=2 Tax=Psilocybe cubensis TaxID=181762 RepID=A0ACB8GPP4_PSICU|nr:MFS-type transporter pytF [Psilocybe cubensis]KAH9477434.1 MFS-type transporter pytF [Psilocybe cubensis]